MTTLQYQVNDGGNVMGVHSANGGASGVTREAAKEAERAARLHEARAREREKRAQEREQRFRVIRSDVGAAEDHIRRELLPARLLYVRDDTSKYQRPYDENRALEMAERWDWRKCQSLTVSLGCGERDGMYEIIDGQHRWNAAWLLFGKEVRLPCDVVDASGVRETADIFLDVNTKRKGIGIETRFIDMLLAHRPEALAIARVLQSLGLAPETERSNHETKRGQIAATATLLRLHAAIGERGLHALLSYLHDAWDDNPHGYEGDMLMGLAQFLARYHAHENFRRARVILRMQECGPSGIRDVAATYLQAMQRKRPTSIAAALWRVFNDHLGVARQLPPFPVEGNPGKTLTKLMAQFGEAAAKGAQ